MWRLNDPPTVSLGLSASDVFVTNARTPRPFLENEPQTCDTVAIVFKLKSILI